MTKGIRENAFFSMTTLHAQGIVTTSSLEQLLKAFSSISTAETGRTKLDIMILSNALSPIVLSALSLGKVIPVRPVKFKNARGPIVSRVAGNVMSPVKLVDTKAFSLIPFSMLLL